MKPACQLTDVEVRIVNRMNAAGNQFTELHHTWLENGQRRKALSRVPYRIDDTPHSRAAQVQAFIKRMERYRNAR